MKKKKLINKQYQIFRVGILTDIFSYGDVMTDYNTGEKYIVVKNAYRLWYEQILQALTLSYYSAKFYYEIQPLKNF